MLILNAQNRSLPLGPAVAPPPLPALVPFTETPMSVPVPGPAVLVSVPAPVGPVPAYKRDDVVNSKEVLINSSVS